MLYLFLTCLALVALLAYREWGAVRDRRYTGEERVQVAVERAEAAKELAEWRRQVTEERAASAEERRELYQRIQAPEVAVQEAVRKDRPPHQPRRPIGADDDARYAERDGRG